jgi:glycerophosphoryl diester phosphodiesterase
MKSTFVFVTILSVICMACQPKPTVLDIQGHRGCRGLMPENTIPAFLLAVDLGVTTLELDVVLSADGQVVVSHEPWLNPEICLSPQGQKITGEQAYNLFLMETDSIAKCDCGSLPHPRFPAQQKFKAAKPLLVEVINQVKQHCQSNGVPTPKFNIEIKSSAQNIGKFQPEIPQYAEAVLAVAKPELSNSEFNIQSFDVEVLKYIHNNHPEITLAYLVEDEGERTLQQIDDELNRLGFNPEIYSCWFPMLNEVNVAYLHKKGIRIIPWTVNEQADMQHMVHLDVYGIISDYPDRLVALINK